MSAAGHATKVLAPIREIGEPMTALCPRFVGSMRGTFVGDALGMPVENWSRFTPGIPSSVAVFKP